jgi:ribosomal subunit interface protein
VIKYIGKRTKDVRGVHVDLSYFPGHKPEERARVEVNIDLYQGQIVLRAVKIAEDIEKGIDLVQEKLKRQIEKLKFRIDREI